MIEWSESMDFLKAVENRRSMYSISSASTIDDGRIRSILEAAILHTPSPNNIQQARIVLLLGTHHARLWDIVMDELRLRVALERFARTESKVNSFKAGYGTVLFFNDGDAVAELSARFPRYSETHPIWAHHSQGMLQFVVWTALESEGLGASLQHYNPIIDDKVRAEWGIHPSWQLVAQMPFGKPTAPAGEKTFLPIEMRLKVFNG